MFLNKMQCIFNLYFQKSLCALTVCNLLCELLIFCTSHLKYQLLSTSQLLVSPLTFQDRRASPQERRISTQLLAQKFLEGEEVGHLEVWGVLALQLFCWRLHNLSLPRHKNSQQRPQISLKIDLTLSILSFCQFKGMADHLVSSLHLQTDAALTL